MTVENLLNSGTVLGQPELAPFPWPTTAVARWFVLADTPNYNHVTYSLSPGHSADEQLGRLWAAGSAAPGHWAPDTDEEAQERADVTQALFEDQTQTSRLRDH